MSGTSGLLLAAGAGRRAGGPKALRVDGSGRTWVERSAEVLADGGCDRVVVVLGAGGQEAAAALAPALGARLRTVTCTAWADGMGRSLRTGLEAVATDDPTAVMITLVDLPDVGADVVARLRVAAGGAGRGALARATYGGVPGHPVLVGADHLAAMAAGLDGDHGGRAFLEQHGVTLVECGDLARGTDVDGPALAGTPSGAGRG